MNNARENDPITEAESWVGGPVRLRIGESGPWRPRVRKGEIAAELARRGGVVAARWLGPSGPVGVAWVREGDVALGEMRAPACDEFGPCRAVEFLLRPVAVEEAVKHLWAIVRFDLVPREVYELIEPVD